MTRRAFTLVEVLVSLAIFALAAVSLGAAYSNVLLSRQTLRIDEQSLEDRARVIGAMLEAPNYDDVVTGGEVNLPGDRTASWKGEIEATPVSDLFKVTIEAEMAKKPSCSPTRACDSNVNAATPSRVARASVPRPLEAPP
jgi:general secretion pathway protein I